MTNVTEKDGFVRALAVSSKRRRQRDKHVSYIEMIHNGSRMLYLGDLSDDEYLELSDWKVKIETHFVFDLPEVTDKLGAGFFLARNQRDFTEDYLNHDLETHD